MNQSVIIAVSFTVDRGVFRTQANINDGDTTSENRYDLDTKWIRHW